MTLAKYVQFTGVPSSAATTLEELYREDLEKTRTNKAPTPTHQGLDQNLRAKHVRRMPPRTS